MLRPFRIGTRGSPLALAQTKLVADALRAAHGWGPQQIEIVTITTTGDVIKDRPLAEVGGKALWTKELDAALVEGRTDASVHSMKDVETFRPEALEIVAMLPRADVCDRLIGAPSLAALPAGARFGTSSPRRAAQIKALRPDLEVVPLRGNVATRLAKVDKGEVDASLLAAAGLDRLGHPEIGVALDLLPAPAQGAVGIEMLRTNRIARAYLHAIDHADTHACVAAERQLLAALGGSCHSAVAALARFEGDAIRLRAELLTADGGERVSGEVLLAPGDPEPPARLARALLDRASPTLRATFTE